jgi:4-hydroxybenzoyl-CoA thioesterase
MFIYHRPVRFAEVDAARLVFFARFLDFCHDALEALFEAIPGGYNHLALVRDVGIPTVRIEVDFRRPLRYGDVARFEIDILRLGNTSVTIRHVIHRQSDGEIAALIRHVVVVAKMSTLTPIPIPEDVRALLESHLVHDDEAPA